MKKLAMFLIIISITCSLSLTACQNKASQSPTQTLFKIESYFDHARTYTVVRETVGTTEDPVRSTVSRHITSQDASNFEEFAHTAAKAALDLYDLYRMDFTSVMLLTSAGVYGSYAQASFAADGRGAAGMTGDAPAKECYWKIRAADRLLTEKELAIAELWWKKQNDFPSKSVISSLSYDPQALRQYISDTLNIPYDEVQMPTLKMTEYKLDQSFIDWTISLTDQQTPVPGFETKIKVEPSPGSYLSSGETVSAVLLKDVQVKVDTCDQDYFSPWYGSAKKGESCLVVSGHIQNLDKENFYISMHAEGYNDTGKQVAGTLDIANIAGSIVLYLEYEEMAEFVLHLNLSHDISTVRLFAAAYPIPPP